MPGNVKLWRGLGLSRFPGCRFLLACLLCSRLTAFIVTAAALPEPDTGVLTNALEVRRQCLLPQNRLCAVQLQGLVLWASPAQHQLLLQVDATVLRVEMDLRSLPMVAQGEQVVLEGKAIAGQGRLRDLLVDNDGLHPALERAETIYLPSGRQPIEVSWFNGPAALELQIDYAPPGRARERIPDVRLFRALRPGTNGPTQWAQGLDYHCYEGSWERLPGFSSLPAVKSGTCANFTLDVRTRDQQVGLQFAGYLEVPQAGHYTFWLQSDDGSQLRIGDTALRLRRRGDGALPAPRRLTLGQPIEDCQWAEVTGVLTALRSCPSGGAEAELSLGTNRLYLEVAEGAGPVPALFSSVRATGICRTMEADGKAGPARRLLVASWKQVQVQSGGGRLTSPWVSQVSELRRLGTQGRPLWCAVRLQGIVVAASPNAGWLVLQDDSGAGLFQMDFQGQALQAGQSLVVEGVASVEGPQVRLRHLALVENDRIHQLSEKSGMMFLAVGKHPLHLSWFNEEMPSALEVEYQGPDLPRQRVPAAALFHPEPEREPGGMRWVPGVSYCCYEGPWVRLPDPGLLLPSKEGIATNFNLELTSRPTQVALEFSGFLEVPRAGLYTFWVRSDDGSRLWLGEEPARLAVTGHQPVPAPVRLAPGQLLREDQESQWSQVEGTITFVDEQPEGLELGLSARTGHMRVRVLDPAGASPWLLLNSRVRVRGLPQRTYTSEGQRVAGALLTPSLKEVEFVEVAARHWSDYPVVPLARLNAMKAPETFETLVHVCGRLRAGQPGGPLLLGEGAHQVGLDTTQPPPPTDGTEVEALGRWSRAGNQVILQGGCYRALAPAAQPGTNSLPRLTTIERVKGLSREEAERGYPVHIRGILTVPLFGGFFIQDSTSAIYVSWDAATNLTLHAGDYWEVQGKTFAEFAPNIRATCAVRLGPGILPEPLHPTWDQLLNGSLDTRYVEVQGIVTRVEGDSLCLLTRSGKINVELPDAQARTLRRYENALLRVRGCLMPGRDADTQQVELGRIQLLNSALTVDEPPPADPFATPLKPAADLLRFDPHAGAIQRVKIAGQVVHARRGEYFLLEGASGLRFVPKEPVNLHSGDLAEVVGFPLLGGPSPVLREVVARRTGHTNLPPARVLPETNLLSRQYEATLVRVKARLVHLSVNRAEQVLELQAGTRGFVARLDARPGLQPEQFLPGSLLELTGVYAGQGGDPASGRELEAFELLLNSPLDIQVLQRPSWWTLRHTLTVVGGMTLVLCAASVWITLLRRQVEERSRQLAVAIRRQEQAESQHALEAERARVARDLHDDLGAALTEIGLLGGLAQRTNTTPERVRDHLTHITDKAREMVTTLDEIVWSLNPKHDSLVSLSKYFCEYAQQFLQLTPVRCRLEVAEDLPDCPLSSDQRHHLLLAFKEALTNVVRHAQATEAHIGIGVEQGALVVSVTDDGRGWDGAAHAQGADGLHNLSGRLKALGGSCEVSSESGRGTCVRLVLPVLNPTVLGSGKKGADPT